MALGLLTLIALFIVAGILVDILIPKYDMIIGAALPACAFFVSMKKYKNLRCCPRYPARPEWKYPHIKNIPRIEI